MNDRETLAEVLRPACAAILEQIMYEACLTGDQARLPPRWVLREILDRGTERALRAIALSPEERRAGLRALIAASRDALDRLAVPAIARLGLSRIGLRHARAAVERAAIVRVDGSR